MVSVCVGGSMNDGFYSSKEWHKLRSKTKALWKAKAYPCGYCHQPIDWTQRVSVDHIMNRKKHPDLALSMSNLQVVHHECNTKKAAYYENNNKIEVQSNGFPVGSDWG